MLAPRTNAIVTGLLVVGLLTGCEAAENIGGPDPDAAASALATALGSGDFQAVTFTDTTADEAKRSYAKVTEGMGEVEPAVEVAGVEDAGDTATVQLAWSWPLGGQAAAQGGGGTWAYRAEASLRLVDDKWQAVWKPTLVESSLKADEVLDSSVVGPDRGKILGAGGQALVADRPVERFGIDRTQVKAARAGESARQLAQLVGVDAAPYVKQVEAAGEEAFIEAIVFRRDDVPPDVDPRRPRRDPRRHRRQRRPAARADPRVRGPDPGHGRRGHRRDDRGRPREVPDRRRGRAVRPPGAVRRPAARHPRRGRPRGRRPTAPSASCSAEEPTPGKPLRLTLDLRLQQAAERLLADVGPASALVAIRPSTGDVLAAANGPGTDGYNMATFGQFAPGSTFKSVSSLALLRDGLTPSSTVPCTEPDRRGRQGVRELRRLPGRRARPDPAAHRGGQLLQHRLHLPGRQARRRRAWWTPPPRSAWASTTTSASRRTSAASSRRRRRPRPPPT